MVTDGDILFRVEGALVYATATPFTNTYSMPTGYWCGSWKVDRSITVSPAALEALIGASFPNRRSFTHDVMLRAASRRSEGGLRVQTDAVALSASVRQAIRDLGADPPTELQTMETVRSSSVAERRFVLLLVGVFGVLALSLAALGVFGVITLIAAERTTEVGIRMALGARPADVLKMMLGQAARLSATGVLIGALGALALTPLLEAQLFGVGAQDPLTFLVVAAGLLTTAVAAAYLPARRAMSVDPVNALRN